VRQLYADSSFAQQVAQLFGREVLDANGHVDKKVLGAKVFGDGNALSRLEALVHPAVEKLRAQKIAKLLLQQPPPVAVVNEAVKLIESGHVAQCDEVWCVTTAPEIQLQRLMQSRGLSREQAQARLSAQPSRAEKQKLMEYFAPGVPLIFLPNEGTPAELARKVDEQWQRFLGEPGSDKPLAAR
jgi:dephospho-CoA kinase